MDDLIRRSDAIEALTAEFCITGKENARTVLNYLDLVTARIKAIPSADRPQEWIPCSERLPKKQGHYICTCKDGSKYKRTTVVKWSNGWQLTGARAYWIVLAWMPLPSAYQGE